MFIWACKEIEVPEGPLVRDFGLKKYSYIFPLCDVIGACDWMILITCKTIFVSLVESVQI